MHLQHHSAKFSACPVYTKELIKRKPKGRPLSPPSYAQVAKLINRHLKGALEILPSPSKTSRTDGALKPNVSNTCKGSASPIQYLGAVASTKSLTSPRPEHTYVLWVSNNEAICLQWLLPPMMLRLGQLQRRPCLQVQFLKPGDCSEWFMCMRQDDRTANVRAVVVVLPQRIHLNRYWVPRNPGQRPLCENL